jgi:hypothetical protein
MQGLHAPSEPPSHTKNLAPDFGTITLCPHRHIFTFLGMATA